MPDFVVTREEPGPFPYYYEEPLPILAARLRTPCFMDVEGEALLDEQPVDVLLVATYHRILLPSLLQKVAWPINLHPSLLPHYRGSNPFYWVIRNGELRTGVTAHLLSSKIDAGSILWRESLDVAADETQGSLRLRLAALAARGAVAALTGIVRGETMLQAQDEDAASSFPRMTDADRIIRPEWTIAEAERIIRACSPFPGALADGRLVVGNADAATSRADAERLRVQFVDGELLLQLA